MAVEQYGAVARGGGFNGDKQDGCPACDFVHSDRMVGKWAGFGPVGVERNCLVEVSVRLPLSVKSRRQAGDCRVLQKGWNNLRFKLIQRDAHRATLPFNANSQNARAVAVTNLLTSLIPAEAKKKPKFYSVSGVRQKYETR